MSALSGSTINCPVAKHSLHERWRHLPELFSNDHLSSQLLKGNYASGQYTRASFTSSTMTDILACSGSVVRQALISEHCACIWDYCLGSELTCKS